MHRHLSTAAARLSRLTHRVARVVWWVVLAGVFWAVVWHYSGELTVSFLEERE